MKVINWFKENYILTLILALAAFLRFYKVDFQSLWLDEIHTINEADPNKSFGEVYQSLLVSEPHPPLYFFLIHILFKIFGYTTLVARCFAAIIGIAGVYSIYLLGKELFDKKIGICAALLLAFNYFHIYYSQEARMYPLLFLTTTISFIYLIRFIKAPTYKTAIIYGLSASLMIYSHFFALFTLFSQALILLYYIVYPYAVTRKKFLIFSAVSGLIITVLYIPTYALIVKTTEIKSIWIEKPTLDVFTQFFKDFFGNSEIVVFLAFLMVILFFLKLFNSDISKRKGINPIEDKMIFSALLLLVWIFITLLLPLIRTYTSLPMLINRYFINILPAVIIIIAIGFSSIKNKTVSYGLMALVFIFSITDTLIVKKYYSTVNKTQFREVSQFILDNNTAKDPVVTSLSWYFPFYLNNGKVKTTIEHNTLDDLVTGMINDNSKVKSFWYVNGHIQPYKVTEQTQKFLDEKFSIENNIELFDCWARHYVVGSSDKIQTVDISKFKDPQPFNGDNFMSNIEKFEILDNKVNVAGFAYFEGQSAATSNYNILLIKDNVAYKFKTIKISRPDVTDYFKSSFDVSNSGFNSTIDISGLPSGKYKVAMHLINKQTNKEGLIVTDKIVEKQ
ncbi:glycosyltransferase family 39 protein [Flavobacterium sp.]